MAETDKGTSMARSERFWAVTTTSSNRSGADCAGPAFAPGAGSFEVESTAAEASEPDANAVPPTETKQHAAAMDLDTRVFLIMSVFPGLWP
jgi:hypothetical protein